MNRRVGRKKTRSARLHGESRADRGLNERLLSAVCRRTLDQLAQVQLLPQLFDQLEVGLEVVDVLCLVVQDLFEQIGG